MKRWVIILAASIILIGCKNKCPKSQTKAGPAEPVKLNIFYTNDLLGEIDLCGCPSHNLGGIARRAKYIERFQQLGGQVIQVDAGDGFFRSHALSSPPNEAEKQNALVLAKGAAKLQVNAINVGWADLAAGVEFLNQLQGSAKEKGELNLISSNLFNRDQARLVFPAQKIVPRSGIKIGIFGLCRPGEGLPSNLTVLDPQTIAAQMVKALKETEKTDLVIGLFNLGLEESKRIVSQTPGMDFVVVSGTPQLLWDPELVNSTILVQSGPGGKYLGQLEVKYLQGRKPENLNKELKRIDRELAMVSRELSGLQGKIGQDPAAKER